jgi:beta-lactamase regulating signal transducer with metallopeptidase domain
MDVLHSVDHWLGNLWPLLLDHLWQSTLVSTLVLAAAHFLKRAPASARFGLCLIGSAKLLVPSIAIILLGSAAGINLSRLWARPATGSTANESFSLLTSLTAPGTRIAAGGAAIVESSPRAESLHAGYFILAAIWMAGFLAVLASWMRKRIGLKFLLRYARTIEEGAPINLLSSAGSRLGIKRRVRLAVAPVFIEPGIWGAWRPMVLLPEVVFNELTESELETVLIHELTHVRRWDNLLGDLHMILCCVFWFHPLVWVLDRKLLAERERACDESVMRQGVVEDDYLSGLMKIKNFCIRYQIAGASYATGSNFKRRIASIMDEKNQKRLLPSHRALIGIVGAIALALSLAGGSLSRSRTLWSTVQAGSKISGPTRSRDGVARTSGNTDLLAEQVDFQFDNVDGAPLTIIGATGIMINTETKDVESSGAGKEIVRVSLTLVNDTDRSIKEIALEHYAADSEEWSRTFTSCSIGPRAMYKWDCDIRLTKSLDLVRPRLGAARFDDDSIWGTFGYPLPLSMAKVRVQPTYSAVSHGLGGPVTLEITIDENGNVEQARAVSGPPELGDASVAAAYQWKWFPFNEKGKPIKKVGTISFAIPNDAPSAASR